MADAIFISYRRDDSEGEAGRLFDDLTRAFGSDAVFMDVAGIKPGVDFRRAIEQNVASCGVLLAMIGPRWLTTTNADGTRRLDDTNDFVALEIASAMKRDVPVIPVLVHDATMPAADRLPETLKDLAFHNSVELSHARWNSDVGLLVEALKAYVTPTLSASATTVHATVPVQLPASHPPTGAVAAPTSSPKTPLIAGVAIAVVVALGGIGYFVTRQSRDSKAVENASVNSTATPTATSPTAPAVVPAPEAPVSGAPMVAAQVIAEKATPVSAPLSGANGAYLGTWKRSASVGSGDTLGMLVISKVGDGVMMHAFGSCQAPVCDWGSQVASSDGGSISATFSPSPSGSDTSRTARVITHVVPSGLDVTIQNTFESPAGARHNAAHTLFLNVK